jgi:coenzyme F420-reducing hydrogenase delta subunit/NAD-dependent dihydropyrimidine dehydrogenase PreA subunit
MPAGNIRSLSDYGPDDTGPNGGAVAFIVGLAQESNPVVTKTAMTIALELHTTGKGRAYFLTRNLKVAENGLERLYRETKAAGVTYVKFDNKAPEFHQSESEALAITFEDEYTRTPFRLTPSLVIVDEVIGPSPHLFDLADIFRLHTDPAGFIQKENVHRVGIFTNRRGIYAVGPARGVLPLEAQMADADDAAQTIAHQILEPDQEPGRPTAEISLRRCVRCLTCYRLCPYGAIRFNTRVNVIPAACEGCGLCAAECPQKAITIEQLEVENIKNLLGQAPAHGSVDPPPARIIAFCCSRSALPAGRTASCMQHALPSGLQIIEVPCAGGISIQHLLAAFETRADGVLVLTCHQDNCHSDYGNQYAGKRVGQLHGLLRSIGIAPERLALKTLASNMGAEFADICSQFEKELEALGPL